MPKMPTAAASGTLCWPRKSDIASPIPVVNSFSTQKMTVISGTFVTARRAACVVPPGVRDDAPEPALRSCMYGLLIVDLSRVEGGRDSGKRASRVAADEQDGCGEERDDGVAAEHGETGPRREHPGVGRVAEHVAAGVRG